MFDDVSGRSELPELPGFRELARPLETDPLWQEVPVRIDSLPDGRVAQIVGAPERFVEGHHAPGDNPHGFRATSGLVLCELHLRAVGVEVTEGELVDYALARGRCTAGDDPRFAGASSLTDLGSVLEDHGLPARVEECYSLEDLAAACEDSVGAIAAVNAGALWGEPDRVGTGEPNHVVAVAAVARAPDSGEILGFWVHDVARGAEPRFVKAETMQAAWLSSGGYTLLTELAF